MKGKSTFFFGCSEEHRLLHLFGVERCVGGYRWSNDMMPKLLDIVDYVEWKKNSTALKDRRVIEKIVIDKGDKEYLMMCLKKNLIPAEDLEHMTRMVTAEKKYRDTLPLVVLKKHGCLEEEVV